MKIGESKEDYLEAAYVLKRQKGYVRNSMLSDYLNYSKASVSVAVRGLLADGYVIKDRYGSIELTEEGRKIAKKIYARHVLLEEFWLNHKFCGISDSSRSSVGSYRIASERNIRHQDIRIPVCEES